MRRFLSDSLSSHTACERRPFYLIWIQFVGKLIGQEASELLEDQNQNLDDYTCAESLGPLFVLCLVGKGLYRIVALLVA
jgi:hypothetical protein